jgi:hypothetical protein
MRFHSFEEAQAWMMQAVAGTHARLSLRTSRASRGRRTIAAHADSPIT